MTGRLSTLEAAFVVARRDFAAILLSRSFLFFLLGPLFPIVVGAMAGGVGQKVMASADIAVLGVAMEPADAQAIMNARDMLAPRLGPGTPQMVVIDAGSGTAPAALLASQHRNLAAILSGTLREPALTGPPDRIGHWQGPVSLIAAEAAGGRRADAFPEVSLAPTATSVAKDRRGHLLTAQAAQTLLFLLTMLLAGMVLSNLVEEKGNKIIEVLAAAIPLDALFLGKLFSMLAISFVGIFVWAGTGALFAAIASHALPDLPEPAVGWGLFVALGIIYFSMAYLLLGSVFLSIGSMAATVREVQTLAMPVTMMQLMVFFLASYAMAQPGSAIETFALVFPFSSPFSMLAHAAQEASLLPHVFAVAWQALCVLIFVRVGAGLFRKRVMKSGTGQPGRTKRFARSTAA